ncbi:MAG: DNA mismatch repair protein MutL, partial [Alistipes sp.]|nr:DNA mismatch repair protein MutL [Alistipes sp.]
EIPVLERGAVYAEPRARSNDAYNPFSDEYVDLSAADPGADLSGFDAPYSGDMPAEGGIAGGYGGYASGRFGASDGEQFEEFVSGGEALESGFDFIPSEGDATQQALPIDETPEFADPVPLAGGYVAATLGGRLVVVDVRRARERILYEDYLRMLSNGSAVCQQLLFPERLMLSGDEYALLEENAVEFAALGFDIDFVGDGAIDVKGAPADLPAEGIDRMLYDLLQAFATPVSLGDVRREKIAAAMALGVARGSVPMLSHEEAAALLARLAETGNVSFSPSGKTVLAEILPEDIRAKLG